MKDRWCCTSIMLSFRIAGSFWGCGYDNYFMENGWRDGVFVGFPYIRSASTARVQLFCLFGIPSHLYIVSVC